jgi:hypothetical protein
MNGMHPPELPPAPPLDPSHELPSARRFDPSRELPLPQPQDPFGIEHEVERRVRKVEAHVRARPFATVAMALVAGFIVGRVLRD